MSQSKYSIREANTDDMDAIIGIYHSNHEFLRRHLGVNQVDRDFIAGEMAKMQAAHFLSCVIAERRTKTVMGVLDYKPDQAVYLSLMMLDSKFQRKGVGAAVYRLFEEEMRSLGKNSVRIDVVKDHEENAVGFWEKQGFAAEGQVKLNWGEKQSNAIVMLKTLDLSDTGR